MVVFGQSGCFRAKVVKFGRKSGFIRANEVVFGQKSSYSGKVVVFRQNCCNRSKVVVLVAKVVVLGQK